MKNILATFFALSCGLAFAGPSDSKDMKEVSSSVAEVPEEHGLYVAAFGATIFDQDYYNPSTSTGTAASPSTRSTPSITDAVGNGGGLKIGYTFAPMQVMGGFKIQAAVEAEGSYVDPRVWWGSGYNYTPPAPPPPPVLEIADPAYHIRESGSLQTASFFLNGILRFQTNSFVTPYVGIGVGGQYVRFENVDISVSANGVPISQTDGLHDDDFCFALQGLAGLDFRIARHWSIFTEYKYMVAFDPSFSFNNYDGAGSNNTVKTSELGQHTISAGLKYNF